MKHLRPESPKLRCERKCAALRGVEGPVEALNWKARWVGVTKPARVFFSGRDGVIEWRDLGI